jgi:hypothetical protein
MIHERLEEMSEEDACQRGEREETAIAHGFHSSPHSCQPLLLRAGEDVWVTKCFGISLPCKALSLSLLLLHHFAAIGTISSSLGMAWYCVLK